MKNKTILFWVILFLGLLFCFGLVWAGTRGPNECCLLDHNLTDIDSACKKGTVVGPKDCATTSPSCDATTCKCANCGEFKCWCDVNDDTINDAPCIFTGGCPPAVVGASFKATTTEWSTCCIIDSIYNFTDWIFYVLWVGIAIMFIVGGFFFITASGDPNKVKQAQSFLFYGCIGILLALMARIIPAILKSFVN